MGLDLSWGHSFEVDGNSVQTLHRDMYSLKAPGTSIHDVEPLEPDPLTTSRYSCVYWIDHLYDSKSKSLADSVRDL
jgi:hypothetical protein